MLRRCRAAHECESAALRTACPGVPMDVACEGGMCRTRRTDGCDAPYEMDAEGMRRTIVDCAN